MKHIIPLVLALASLSALAPSAAAQAGPIPVINSVPQRKSYAPNNVAILGTNLGLASDVKVNGVSYPIVRVTASRLVVGPVDPQLPGFGTVELIHGRGIETATIELLPTLKVQRSGARLDVRLNNGDLGTYVVRYAYRLAATPATDQGIYGLRYLPSFSATLASGVFPDANPLVLQNLVMPVQIGQIGSDLRLQAECYAATTDVTAYTNVVAVGGYGNPVHP